jgi:hypothetical protein
MTLDANVLAFAASLLIMFPIIAALEWQNKRKRAAAPHNQPQSRKHVRYSLWSDRIVVTYYNHAGRKVTTRTYPIARYYAVLRSARAKGYRVV